MYAPNAPPSNPADVAQWAMNEFTQLARLFNDGYRIIIIEPSYAAPARPREGMVANADGTTWNPGGGAGLYQRLAGAWVKL
jgi:hypothetical protein